jgi:hypothetical protein
MGVAGPIPFIVRDPNLGAASFAPFLSITLVGAKSIRVSGLLDTGATVSVLPYGVGEQIGAVFGVSVRIRRRPVFSARLARDNRIR